MKRGVPPTALNARTGEFTPPGVTACARSKSAADRAVDCAVDRAGCGADGCWGLAEFTRPFSPSRSAQTNRGAAPVL